MSARSNISTYFESILKSIRNMEQGARLFDQLHTLGEEIAQLETYVKSSFESLDNHFQTYIEQIDLLSSLIDFQRKIVRYRSAEETAQAAFQYINENIGFDDAFFYLKIGDPEKPGTLVPAHGERLPVYQTFLAESDNLEHLRSMLSDHDLGIILANVEASSTAPLAWDTLEACSAIAFPLRVQGKFLGFGLLTRREGTFQLNQLSFVNLILGMLSLLVFQHYYFFHLKRKLFRQVRLQKVLEEVKFAEYFDRGPLFIFSLDQRGVILHANSAALSGIRLEKEQVVGERFLDFLDERERKPMENIFNKLQLGELRLHKAPLRTQDGDIRVCEFYITKMELHDNFHLDIVFAVDKTEVHYREQQQQRNEMLNGMRDFSSRLTGELSELLSVMVPNVSLLKAKLGDSEFAGNLEALEKALEGTSRLARKFLNYDLRDIEKPREVQVNTLLSEIVSRLEANLQEKVRFHKTLDPGIPALHSYPRRITQLIKILLQNALEAISHHGEVRLSTRLVFQKENGLLASNRAWLPAGRHIELAIEDNGKGISAAAAGEIFKPFFSTRVKNNGSGQGLFIAYAIVKDLQGEIIIRSEVGNGASCFVYLPLEPETEVVRLPEKEIAKPQTRKPAILVVDDEYSIRQMLKDIFELEEYTVFLAGNGREGVEIFEKHQSEIDLVVLDMVMPVMNGKSAFKAIRGLKAGQKIIIISGYAKKEDLDEIVADGALAFMSKPFQINDILNHVKQALNGTTGVLPISPAAG